MIRLVFIAIVGLELSACVTSELYCSGTLQQDGSVQTEPSSLSLAIDVYSKTVTVDNYEPVQWRETSASKVVFFNTIRDDMPGVRTGEFDRRTGRLTVVFNRSGLVMFKGVCERAGRRRGSALKLDQSGRDLRAVAFSTGGDGGNDGGDAPALQRAATSTSTPPNAA